MPTVHAHLNQTVVYLLNEQPPTHAPGTFQRLNGCRSHCHFLCHFLYNFSDCKASTKWGDLIIPFPRLTPTLETGRGI